MQLKIGSVFTSHNLTHNSSCDNEQVMKLHTGVKYLVFWCNGVEVFRQAFESDDVDSEGYISKFNLQDTAILKYTNDEGKVLIQYL